MMPPNGELFILTSIGIFLGVTVLTLFLVSLVFVFLPFALTVNPISVLLALIMYLFAYPGNWFLQTFQICKYWGDSPCVFLGPGTGALMYYWTFSLVYYLVTHVKIVIKWTN